MKWQGLSHNSFRYLSRSPRNTTGIIDSYEMVHEYLGKLGLSVIEGTIDSYLETAHGKHVMDVLDHLLSEEVQSKASKKTGGMLNWLRFPFRKTMDDFDFSFQPSIDKAVIDDLVTLRFIHNVENVVFLGPRVSEKHISPLSST